MNAPTRLRTLLTAVILAGAAAVSCCHAATIAPRNAEEARIQLDETEALRRAMKAANDTAEHEKLRERAAQEAALMAIRNTAPAARPQGPDELNQRIAAVDRTGMFAYAALMAAALIALTSFIYIQTRRVIPIVSPPDENEPIIKAPMTSKRNKPTEPVPVMTNPAERKSFISDVDKLIEKVKERAK